MRIGLVLTNDWELFGNGSGDYFEVQHRPLEALLKTVADHGAKLTVMAEVGQQWAHQSIADRHPWAAEIVSAWEEALIRAVRAGNDVQMHFHPQWLGAISSNGEWKLDHARVYTSRLKDGELQSIFARGRSYLNGLLKPADPDYECLAFRAGGYLIEPARRVLQALENNGFAADTSVTKGLVDEGYDFRGAHSNCLPWSPDYDDVRRPRSETNVRAILEFPVYSGQLGGFPRFRRLFQLKKTGATEVETEWFRASARRFSRLYPSRKRAHGVLQRAAALRPLRAIKLTRDVLSPTAATQLDYDVLPATVFGDLIEQAFSELAVREGEAIVPAIAVGHVKSMHDTSQISRTLDHVNSRFRGRMVHWTLREAIDYWKPRTVPSPS